MPMTINGDGSITGLVAGGLPDATITQPELAAGVAGNGPAFSACQTSSAQSVSANTFTKITLNTEEFDTNNNFASSRFTPTVAGYYQINGSISTTTPLATSVYYNVYIAKNGSQYATTTAFGSPSNYFSAFVGTVVYLNGTTDFIELYAQSSGAYTVQTGLVNTFLSGVLVRAA
jgi:hypothetical protein